MSDDKIVSAELAFTPGPWKARCEVASEPYYTPTWIVERDDESIPDYRREIALIETVRGEDAHLISAAPELYEALKQIVEHEQIDGTGIRYTFDWHSPFGKAARAALAKAEGQ